MWLSVCTTRSRKEKSTNMYMGKHPQIVHTREKMMKRTLLKNNMGRVGHLEPYTRFMFGQVRRILQLLNGDETPEESRQDLS